MSNITLKIVGIGTSAGGLNALEEFFSHVPVKSDLAFVVVQHLAPNHKCIMAELLQKVTAIPVSQIQNKTLVKANHIYIIPPNKDLFISKGQLQLKAPIKSQGLKLPIDNFFESLAKDLGKNAIGIVFSGMGSDGMLGLQAIKEFGGLTLAQSPKTAKFDSMPLSAINSHSVDIVASAKQLAQNIVKYASAVRVDVSDTLPCDNLTSYSLALDKIFALLLNRSGNDFSCYKNSTVYRRIERRLALHKIKSIEHYADFLAENPQEVDLLFKEMLIGVTSFFRDQVTWQQLISQALPKLLSNYPEGKNLRAWVTACSTGEEAYTLAIAFHESLELIESERNYSLQIFATDLDETAIKIAREGVYAKSIEKDIPVSVLNKYFTKVVNGYQINQKIREMLIFAPQNIVVDPPFTKLDILTCRNLLIYFNPELQKKIIPLFHYALNRNSILMLGNAETIGDFSSLFSKSNYKSSIYHRIGANTQYTELDFPTRVFPIATLNNENTLNVNNMKNNIVNLQSLANEVLLQGFAPAAVLINSDGDILYINGRTGKYLEPAAGRANWNIYAMAREGLRYEIDIAIKKAQHQKDKVTLVGVITESAGKEQQVNLSVQAIYHPDSLAGTIMITFEDIITPAKIKRKVTSGQDDAILKELHQAREQIQLMREEMKISQEELKAANEELQSMNEELQSANEELTTSKEEMQSLNEELQTLNTELQSKVDDLTWLNNDMTNLLDSTEIATVFLDNELNVRRFTTLSTNLFKLINSDVGRPLSDVVTTLEYASLQDDANEVLRTLVFQETQVNANDGRWFKVRIMPYRTQDNRIDGVVITFTDISSFKLLELKLKKAGVNGG